MEKIHIAYNGQEYELDVDIDDTIGVLSFQLYSLLGIEVESQILLTWTGSIVSTEGEIGKYLNESNWFLLIHSENTGIFNPSIDVDWRTSCTRLVSSNIPLVQPAYEMNGVALCRPCATTCTSQEKMVLPIENNAETRNRICSHFICDLEIVTGAANVPAPLGYEKYNYDLNYSATGPFVFLCFKKGGSNRPISHIKVVHTQDPITPPVVKGYTVLPVNCNIGTKSTTGIYLCYRRVSPSNFRELRGLALESLEISSECELHSFTRIPVDLNEGNANSTATFLFYKLNPLGGFVCGHSGTCLFEPRVRQGEVADSWAGLSLNQLKVAPDLESTQQQLWAASEHKRLTREEPRLRQMLESQIELAMKFERKDYQEKALQSIPLGKLQERARGNPSAHPAFEDEVLRQLISWFKHEFFSWTNSPPCQACQNPTQMIRTEGPVTSEEIAGSAGRVELHQCTTCQVLTRFPRYNDPTKLLQTRTGRCGEWANCFTLCCRALGYEARYVHDFTDHVWTEVYSNHYQRWLHCDPCEDQLDCPLTYEVGWGKKLTYIFAASCEELVDVSRRYTRDFESLLDRRTMAREEWLQSTIRELNALKTIIAERRQVLERRAVAEERELSTVRVIKDHEKVGRISGSKEWRDARDETGGSLEVSNEASGVDNTSRPVLNTSKLLQGLLQSLLQGGCANDQCMNPYCLCLYIRQRGFNMTQHTAHALQLIGKLQAASAEGLCVLKCPTQNSFMDQILSYEVVLYYPLQDHLASLVVDASIHAIHMLHSGLRLGKQLAVRGDKNATGLQLGYPHHVSFNIPKESNTWTLMWLLQLNEFNLHKTSDAGPFLVLESSKETLKFAFTTDYRMELVAGTTTSTSKSSLDLDTTYHIALVKSDIGIIAFINGNEVLRSATPLTSDAPIVATFGLLAESKLLPLISHVALTTTPLIKDQIQALVKACVPPTKLTKFGVESVPPTIECTEDVAFEDSGYRLSAVHLWAGDFFDGLQCEYMNKDGVTVPGRSWTVSSSTKHSLKLNDGEYIIKVEGRRGAWMDQLSLTTNFGRNISAGGNGGGPFEINIPVGQMIRAFHFDLGDHVNQPVVFTTKAPPGYINVAFEAAQREHGKVAVVDAARAVERYLTNIANDPSNTKYYKIKCSNVYFQKNITPLGSYIDAIFTSIYFDRQDENGDVFYFFKHTTPPHLVHGVLHDTRIFINRAIEAILRKNLTQDIDISNGVLDVLGTCTDEFINIILRDANALAHTQSKQELFRVTPTHVMEVLESFPIVHSNMANSQKGSEKKPTMKRKASTKAERIALEAELKAEQEALFKRAANSRHQKLPRMESK